MGARHYLASAVLAAGAKLSGGFGEKEPARRPALRRKRTSPEGIYEMSSSARRALFFAPRLGRYRFALLSCLGLLGCFYTPSQPPEVRISQITSYPAAAKGRDCNMPVLYSEPEGKYARIAIVEGWAGGDKSSELLAEIRQRACETGADALLVVEKRSQVIKPHPHDDPVAEQEAQATEDTESISIRNAQMLREAEGAPRSGSYIDAVAIVYRKRAN